MCRCELATWAVPTGGTRRYYLVEVDECHARLVAKGIPILHPPQDHTFGHRTLFFRDPEGNVLEIYAEL